MPRLANTKLVEAFAGVQKIKSYRLVRTDQKTPQKLSKQQYDDIHADILATILAHMPRTDDLKIRMDGVQDITDAVMKIMQKELQS